MGRFPAFLVVRMLSGLGGIVLVACSTPSPPPTTTAAPSPLYPEEVASALLTDELLAQQLEIQDQRFTRDTDRIVLAEGILLNKTDQPLVVEVRTLFKNTQGETLETSSWKRLTLPPKIRVAQNEAVLSTIFNVASPPVSTLRSTFCQKVL
jgi:hypothetical protein